MNIKTSHQLDILVKEYYHRQLSEGCILPSHFQLIFAEPSIGRAEEQLAGCVNTKQWLQCHQCSVGWRGGYDGDTFALIRNFRKSDSSSSALFRWTPVASFDVPGPVPILCTKLYSTLQHDYVILIFLILHYIRIPLLRNPNI